MPFGNDAGTQVRVIAGEFLGLRSPVETQSALFYADVALEPGAQLAIPSSSRERIEQAKQDWQAGRFGGVPGDPEFIPLPDERKPRVDYP